MKSPIERRISTKMKSPIREKDQKDPKDLPPLSVRQKCRYGRSRQSRKKKFQENRKERDFEVQKI